MGHLSYNRVSSGRGFRLNPRRVCVLGLRKRLAFFLRLFNRCCKLSYKHALRVFDKMLHRRSGFRRNNSSSSRSSLVKQEQIKGRADCRLRSFGRSNSFYSEAIAECLEFIKRTSISMEQIQDPVVTHIQ
ncbi:hypothetical protein G2W53_020249 [Senna tora]|uniref:Uncharacterized protein n=1 Tax=Senna tora TaxID=362788 RepID=A0A834WMQ7_9FABA|nr:hypothetical protein G2W53_020249 [Senna tora]